MVRQSFLNVCDQGDAKRPLLSQQCGQAGLLMGESKHHARLPVSYLRTMIEPAARHRQLKLYFNLEGKPVAYVAWAYLTPAVAGRILARNDAALHPSEWNEGGELWIIDLLVTGGHFPYVWRDLRERVFGDAEELRYFRRMHGRLAARHVRRRQADIFLVNR